MFVMMQQNEGYAICNYIRRWHKKYAHRLLQDNLSFENAFDSKDDSDDRRICFSLQTCSVSIYNKYFPLFFIHFKYFKVRTFFCEM